MSPPVVRVCFAEHVPTSQMAGMVSGIAAYGNITPEAQDRCFLVEVFRVSKLPHLKDKLAKLEVHGYLRYSETDDSL